MITYTSARLNVVYALEKDFLFSKTKTNLLTPHSSPPSSHTAIMSYEENYDGAIGIDLGASIATLSWLLSLQTITDRF